MNEKFISIENLNEDIPSETEIRKLFELILNERKSVEIGRVEDEMGLFTWDIESLDSVGDKMEISYQRARTFTNGVTTNSRITVTLFDSKEVPCGCGDQYDYIDGEWVQKF